MNIIHFDFHGTAVGKNNTDEALRLVQLGQNAPIKRTLLPL